MVWHFIGVYIINRTLHDRLEIRNFSTRVEKYFTRSPRSLVKYFSTLVEKFRISARPCNILYLLVSAAVEQTSFEICVIWKYINLTRECTLCYMITVGVFLACLYKVSLGAGRLFKVC